MKKLLLFMLVPVMLFAFVACGDAPEKEEDTAIVTEEQAKNDANNEAILPKLDALESVIVEMEVAIADKNLVEEYQPMIDLAREHLDSAKKSHQTNIDAGGYLEGTAEFEAAIDEEIAFHKETLELIAKEGLTVVVQWPAELDGIPGLRGFTPNSASMNPDGLVNVDYSDVTAEDIDEYRAVISSFGFEPYDLGTGVEAYYKIDDEGTTFLVAINPQADVEGHLQISGIITPKE